MNTLTASHYRQVFDAISESVDGVDARHQALERFIAHGLPTTREEDWKYTSLDALERAEWHAPEHASAATVAEDYPGAALKFSNGRLADSTPQALHAYSLAAHADSALVRQHLGKLANDAALTQINNALWQDGLLLHVPAQLKLPPLFVAHHASEADAMLHVRTLIVLEAGAEAVLVEHYRGTSDLPYWHNGVTEIVLGAGARLTHLKLTEESAAATHTS